MKTKANTVGKALRVFITLFIATLTSCSVVPVGGGLPPPTGYGQFGRPVGPIGPQMPHLAGGRRIPNINDIQYTRKFNGTWTIVDVDANGKKTTRVVGLDNPAGMTEAEKLWKREGHQLPSLSPQGVPRDQVPEAVRRRAESELMKRGYRQ